MPRPKSLSNTQIAQAAIAVIEEEGVSALSMRAVAERLGMGTMSLYRYVDSREQLETLVVSLVFGSLDLTPPRGESWERRTRTLVERLRAAARAHPATVPLLVTRGHQCVALLRWLETLLGVLRDGGFSAADRVIAARAIGGYAVGATQLAHLAPASGRAEQFAPLSSEDFPLLREAGERARHLTPDQEFHAGLAALLKGLKRGAGA